MVVEILQIAVQIFVDKRLIRLEVGNGLISGHFTVSDCYSTYRELEAQENCVVGNNFNIELANSLLRKLFGTPADIGPTAPHV